MSSLNVKHENKQHCASNNIQRTKNLSSSIRLRETNLGMKVGWNMCEALESAIIVTSQNDSEHEINISGTKNI